MKKILCFLFNHKYKIKRHVTRSIKELECTRCGAEFGINYDAQALLPLTDDLREVHKIMSE